MLVKILVKTFYLFAIDDLQEESKAYRLTLVLCSTLQSILITYQSHLSMYFIQIANTYSCNRCRHPWA